MAESLLEKVLNEAHPWGQPPIKGRGKEPEALPIEPEAPQSSADDIGDVVSKVAEFDASQWEEFIKQLIPMWDDHDMINNMDAARIQRYLRQIHQLIADRIGN